MPFAPLSFLGGQRETGCEGAHFPIHSDWNSRRVVSMAGVCDCVKECESFIMWLLLIVFVYLILFGDV